MLKPGLNVIIDGQWGSTGKGKLAGYLTGKYKPDAVICDFMPNAGHTFVEDDGTKHVFKQLPVAASRCFDDTPIYVGPHSAIDPKILLSEIAAEGCSDRLFIHPLTPIIEACDRETEQNTTGYIAATCKGGHSASSRKALRSDSAVLARDVPIIRDYCCDDFHDQIQGIVRRGGTVLAETAQGFDLGLNHGWAYPYVTGRDCLLGRVCDNAGVSPRRLVNTILSLRTYPIRVGNTDSGMSGPFYPDQTELSWPELSELEDRTIHPETTTVTGRIRRVFSFSDLQVKRALNYLEPDCAFLNFVNYWKDGENDDRIRGISSWLDSYGKCHLSLLGTGPADGEMVEVH